MRRLPLHPLLFATFPVLFLFVQNAERVRFGKVIGPLIAVVAATIALTVLASVLLRSARRGALIASGAALLALSYGHVWTAVQDDKIAGVTVGRDMFLLPLWALLGVGVLAFAWRVKALGDVTAIVNLVAAGLVVVSVVNTSSAVAAQSGRAFQANPGRLSREIAEPSGNGTTRDIYYLIFDRYGSRPAIKEALGFDNSPFIEALEERGFFVADEAQSNYPTTAHSVASSLNMDYLNDLAKRPGKDSEDWKPLYRTIPGARVPRFLQDQGYEYAHIGPWYDPTASDKTAQVNYHYDKTSEFTRVLVRTTLLHPLAKRIGWLKEFDDRQSHRNQILFQFDSILDASKKFPGPTYTFAHILLPHEPFVFYADGRYKTEDESKSEPYADGYVAQIQFANKKILQVVDRLLDVPAEEQPIIVLQADEGMKRYEGYGDEKRWKDATDEMLREKVGILNAFYTPGGVDVGLYEDITPVNNFRVLFNAYFGTDLELLPDRNYVYGNGKEPYRFTDITDRVNP